MTVYSQYDFVLVSGVQQFGYTTMYFTKWPPLNFQYPPNTIHSYYITIDCIPCALCRHDYFVATNLYFLLPPPFSPRSPNPLPASNHQFGFCVCESVSVLFVYIVL